jgi:septal ring factor EnvC (AmiA/AmiB activator)
MKKKRGECTMNHVNHTHSDEKLAKEIEGISKGLKQSETLKIQSETELKTLRTQYKKVEGEIVQMGIDPKKAEEALALMDAEMAQLLDDIKNLMPQA